MTIRTGKLTTLGLLLLAHSTVALASELKVVRVSKEEIAAAANPRFIKSRDLGDVLAEKISLLAVTLTSRQGGSNRALVDIAGASRQTTREGHFNKLAILHYVDEPSARVDSGKLQQTLLGQTRKSGEVKFKEAFPIIQQFQKGLSFNWRLMGETPSKASSKTPSIRYGLIVQDILPHASPAMASLSSMSDSYLEYSRPAQVVYTIDRLEEDSSSRKVFSGSVEETPVAPTAQQIFRKPSTDVAVTIDAANADDSVSDKVGGGSLPRGRVTLKQADGLFSTQLITNSRLGKDSITHEAKLPIVGEASITRKWNDSFKTTQTSANNLLVRSSAPKLNVHYLNLESRFKGELLVKNASLEMGIALEPRTDWAPKDSLGRTGDKISVSLLNKF